MQKNAYVWENFEYNYPNDWNQLYQPVYYANEVLYNLKKVERTTENTLAWDNVKGSALLYRAEYFLRAVWIFAKAYDENTAKSDLGIVLRVEPDFEQSSKRATVQESYDKILTDLKEAALLLPERPVHVMRPSKAAAYGLLARTYLSMRVYDSTLKYSNLALGIFNQLLDFSTVNYNSIASTFAPFPNPEIIISFSISVHSFPVGPGHVRVDSNLLRSYVEGDLRKPAFFSDARVIYPTIGGTLFKGSYFGSFSILFTGLTTAEMYLTRAECYARKGEVEKALNDINLLMSNRCDPALFQPFETSEQGRALSYILEERRKELVFRGLRWMDIKRLNKEGAGIVLTREVEGKTYKLEPNEARYALPIPTDIINMTGMQQNPR